LGDGAPWRDLTVYLRHLVNADAMIERLLDYLRARRRDTVLCFYGDHVPALPDVYARLGCEPVHSDYFMWRNFGDAPAIKRNLRIEELGAVLIRAIGANSTRSVGAHAARN
jgi:phosphoglycerol transferase MdoB-like AlkP superfamily enzyme